MQQVLDSKVGTSRRSPRTLEKRKNISENGEQSKQRWKLGQDAIPHLNS